MAGCSGTLLSRAVACDKIAIKRRLVRSIMVMVLCSFVMCFYVFACVNVFVLWMGGGVRDLS